MSMTIPLPSSVSAKKAASMTKVAPCSACAGPNTAPRNEWAIMMWSRTSTANKGNLSSFGIVDDLAQHTALWRQNIRKPRRKIVKFDRRRQQHVELRIGQQFKRGSEPSRM